ncbi:MAG: hypothetical protein KDD45_05310, partial [Bdellovibrionales bacterium]|nr:hypothetical protein [Bdellovibrionales bacterium]
SLYASLVSSKSEQRRLQLQELAKKTYNFLTKQGFEFSPDAIVTNGQAVPIFKISKFPKNSLIERIAGSLKKISNTEIYVDLYFHTGRNLGAFYPPENKIILTPLSLGRNPDLPSLTLMHEMHHAIQNYLSDAQRKIVLANGLFVGMSDFQKEVGNEIPTYSKMMRLDELSAHRLTEQWRVLSEKKDEPVYGEPYFAKSFKRSSFDKVANSIYNSLKNGTYRINAEEWVDKVAYKNGQHFSNYKQKLVTIELLKEDQIYGYLFLVLPKYTKNHRTTLTSKNHQNELKKEINKFIKILAKEIETQNNTSVD